MSSIIVRLTNVLLGCKMDPILITLSISSTYPFQFIIPILNDAYKMFVSMPHSKTIQVVICMHSRFRVESSIPNLQIVVGQKRSAKFVERDSLYKYLKTSKNYSAVHNNI